MARGQNQEMNYDQLKLSMEAWRRLISAPSVRKTTHGNSITKVQARFFHQYLGKGFWGKKKKSDSGLNDSLVPDIKVARYSFSGSIPPKFQHKLRRQKQSFGKFATTVVLDKDENLFWSGLQRHRSCHSNEMTLLPILLAAVYLGTGNCSSKIIHGSFFLQ